MAVTVKTAWSEVREQRIADALRRRAALPAAYRSWVLAHSWNIGLPPLRPGSRMGPGEWAGHDGLIRRCELEIAHRAEMKEAADAGH
jgi:hypothetical protein